MILTKRTTIIIIAILVLVSLIVGCKKSGQDNTTKTPSDRQKSADPKDPDTKKGEPSGPPALSDIKGYKNWLKMNRKPVDGRTHGLANIYINQTRTKIAPDGKLKFPFPDGTVIVKEVLKSDLVAIMRKVKGFDPDHNDWQWIEYGAGESVAGKDGDCWSCHGGASDRDYVFTKLDSP